MNRALTAAGLLTVWERGRAQSPVERALSLLAFAQPDVQLDSWARQSIGQRDGHLLELHEKIFGPRLVGQAECAQCGRLVELDIAVAELRHTPPPDSTNSFTLQHGDCEVQFRLLNSEDLVSLRQEIDLRSQKRELVSRCIAHATCQGTTMLPDQLPDEMITALSERMAELDPHGDLELALACPHCGHRWQAPLDIVSFLWNEIQSWAERLLREVAMLASAYGWSEADILAMSSRRRQAYLELIER